LPLYLELITESPVIRDGGKFETILASVLETHCRSRHTISIYDLDVEDAVYCYVFISSLLTGISLTLHVTVIKNI